MRNNCANFRRDDTEKIPPLPLGTSTYQDCSFDVVKTLKAAESSYKSSDVRRHNLM